MKRHHPSGSLSSCKKKSLKRPAISSKVQQILRILLIATTLLICLDLVINPHTNNTVKTSALLVVDKTVSSLIATKAPTN